jgi:hypothetical protein
MVITHEPTFYSHFDTIEELRMARAAGAGTAGRFHRCAGTLLAVRRLALIPQ